MSHARFNIIADAEKNLAMKTVQPGDIILVKTPTFMHTKIREFSNSVYDHCIVILSKSGHENSKEPGKYSLNCLQISYPKVKQCEAWPFMISCRQPMIIRPKISQENMKQFIAKSKKLVGKRYNFRQLMNSILKQKTFKENPYKVVCSDAIFKAFWKANLEFEISDDEKKYLDYGRHGTFSVDDFYRVASFRTDEFEVIELYPNSTSTDSYPQTIVNIDDEVNKSILQRYGVVHAFNLLVFIYQYSDYINICFKTVEVLEYLANRHKDSKDQHKLRNILALITKYTTLIKILHEIEEYGLNSKNRTNLIITLLKLGTVNPNIKNTKYVLRIVDRVLDRLNSVQLIDVLTSKL